MTHWTVVSRPGPVESAILDELSPAIEVRRYIAAEVTLRFLQGGEGRPPVVLLHGRGHGAATWWPFLGPLARRGRVAAFDLPGFGHSAWLPWAGGDARDGLRFFAQPIGAALRELDLEGAVIVGHSLGGLVALSVALEAQGRGAPPRGLVLIDAMGLSPSMDRRARLYFRAGPERIARARGPVRRLIEAALGAPPDRAEALRRELLEVRGGRPDAAAAFEAMCPVGGEPLHLEAELARLTVPTMLVWGTRDETFPVAVAERAAATIPSAELHLVDAGHSPHVERSAEVLGLLERFLDRVAI